MKKFDPNNIGIANGNFFGLPCTMDDADIILLPVPWDATASYGKGTAKGPQAIMDASLQVDLFDEKISRAWEVKAAAHPIDEEILNLNKKCSTVADNVIRRLEKGIAESELLSLIAKVNAGSEYVNKYVEELSSKYLAKRKTVGLIGGEHSVIYGLVKALSRKYSDFGILHIDAHSDTRVAYEGFKYSHASIMYNILNEIPQVGKIVQTGIRDFCSAEYEFISKNERVQFFTDFSIRKRLFEGKNWKNQCDEIIDSLPENVYISFDIDGLTPEHCPNTGTPVPGGLTFAEADYLLYELSKSKKIIGFDLCEVAPAQQGEWDASVGARILFKLLIYSNIM